MPFKKGVSPNPGGRSKIKEQQIKELLLPYVPEAVEKLVKALRSDDNYLQAAEKILDRFYGKPTQGVEAKGELTVKVLIGD